MPQSRKEGDTPSHCHAGARHTPGTGHRAVPRLDKGDVGGESSFPRKSRTGTWGLRKEAREQRGSGGPECLKVERGVPGIHSKTSKTDSEG